MAQRMTECLQGRGNIVERIGGDRFPYNNRGALHAGAQIAITGDAVQFCELGFGLEQCLARSSDGLLDVLSEISFGVFSGCECHIYASWRSGLKVYRPRALFRGIGPRRSGGWCVEPAQPLVIQAQDRNGDSRHVRDHKNVPA